MRVDLYKRPLNNGKYSYLAVPEGKPIPNEATNIDWETDTQGIDLDYNNENLNGLCYENALEQINNKGYAITSLKD